MGGAADQSGVQARFVSLAPSLSSYPHPQLSCGRLPPALRQPWMWVGASSASTEEGALVKAALNQSSLGSKIGGQLQRRDAPSCASPLDPQLEEIAFIRSQVGSWGESS
jgi:hypothetical protein